MVKVYFLTKIIFFTLLFDCLMMFKINRFENRQIFNNLLKPLIKKKKLEKKLAKVYSFELKKTEETK